MPASLIASPGTASITVENPGGMNSLPATFTITGASVPSISPGGVITSSSFGAASSIGPYTYVEIYGSNLSTTALDLGNSFVNGMATTTLAGVSATINGQPAFVNYVSPGQVNILTPENLSAGPGALVVTNASGNATYTVNVLAQQPELLAPGQFLINGLQYVGAILSDGSYALPTGTPGGRPARPGETITTYGIGFLSVSPEVPAGSIAPQTLSSLELPFQILFSRAAATVTFAGLSPGFVGLYQFDVVVPQIPDNDAVPLTFTLGGTPGTQTLYIPVHQ